MAQQSAVALLKNVARRYHRTVSSSRRVTLSSFWFPAVAIPSKLATRAWKGVPSSIYCLNGSTACASSRIETFQNKNMDLKGSGVGNIATPLLSSLSYSSHLFGGSNNINDWIAFVVAAATAATVVVATNEANTYTLCDNDNDDSNDEEEDPYDNLPEKDEPTHCSICNTYRQGPCRPYWRKVEACTKDNDLNKEKEDKENNEEKDEKKNDADNGDNQNDPPCLKYMLPWIDCVQGYRNLYTLVELDTNYTLGIAELEEEASRKMCWNKSSVYEPKIDWTEWSTYVQEHEDWKKQQKRKEAKQNKKKRKKKRKEVLNEDIAVVKDRVPLWKTLNVDDPSKDPQLVNIIAKVSKLEGDTEEDAGVLECAFALDQEGNVIGFAYGAESKPSSNDENEKNDNKGEEKPATEKVSPPTVDLTIRLLPTHTTDITIGASYILKPKEELGEDKPAASANNTRDSDASNTEAPASTNTSSSPEIIHLYKSRSFGLAAMAAASQ